jgi:hypothetical protein
MIQSPPIMDGTLHSHEARPLEGRSGNRSFDEVALPGGVVVPTAALRVRRSWARRKFPGVRRTIVSCVALGPASGWSSRPTHRICWP